MNWSPIEKRWQEKGISTPSISQLQNKLTHGQSTNLFIYLIVLFGSLLTVSLFFGILGLFFMESPLAMMVFGALLFGGTLVVSYQMRPMPILFEPMSLVLGCAGIIYFCAGFLGYASPDEVTSAFVLIVISLLIFFFWENVSAKFLSVMLFFFGVWGMLQSWIYTDVVFVILLCLALVGFLFVWIFRPRLVGVATKFVQPLQYALPIVIVSITYLSGGNFIIDDFYLPFTTVSLALAGGIVLFLTRPRSPLQLAVLSLLLIALTVMGFITPLLLVAFLFLLIGKWQNSWFLFLGGILIGLFGMRDFYYTLTWTLLNKSFLLIAIGSICLGLSFLFRPHPVLEQAHE